MTDQPGTLIKDRYRLQHLLGEGGAAEVWRAQDERMDRAVALKRLRPQYARDAKLLERFSREARIIAQLDSPFIVQVYDADVSATERFIAMEFVDGQDLKELLRFEGPLAPPRALALLRDVALGVAAAHAAGLVHRDLKPGNILISKEGQVKVTDFGIARDIAGAGLTEPGTVWGTSHYIAPEQAGGQPVTPATDVYSMGVILFQMLTGRLPFPGDDPVAVAIAHIQQPVPSLQGVDPTIPAGISQLVARMMAKAPAERPPDAGAVARILGSYLQGSDQATVLHATLPPAIEQASPSTVATFPAPPHVEPTVPEPTAPRLPVGTSTRRRAPGWLLPLGAFLGLCALALLGGVALSRGLFGEASGVSTPVAGSAPTVPATATTVTGTATAALATFTTEPNVTLSTRAVPSATASVATPSATPEPTATATTVPIITMGGPRQDNGPDAVAAHATGQGRIEVDGDLREWNRSQPVPLIRPVGGAENWAGETDLSGRAFFAWDNDTLCMAVERTDDQHIQTRTGYDLYRDDSVELWLDVDLLGDFEVAQADKDDFQFAFSAGDFASLRAEGVTYFPERRDEWGRELQVRAQPLPNGYTLEACIPWKVLGTRGNPQDFLGYAVVLNDNDAPTSEEPQTQVANTLLPPFRQPLTFGNLFLQP